MPTLLLRLNGPMQAWGTQSRFSIRDTGLEPSKSGVIGLLCAALGRPRHAPIADLCTLRMGVRVDREGQLASDYHTAQNVLKANGNIKETEPSQRYYLSDAAFLVGLEGPDCTLLQKLQEALAKPTWTLYLGRKAFIPSDPVQLPDGLRLDQTLEQALDPVFTPWQPRPGQEKKPPRVLRLVIEDETGDEVRYDQPLSFKERTFALRHVKTIFIPLNGG